jgi:N-acetylmuramoyl-L-alanine amidase
MPSEFSARGGGSGPARAREPKAAREFVEALNSAGRDIRHPAAKLRFIRNSVDRYESLQRTQAAVPSPGLHRLLLSVLGLERLQRVLAAWERGGNTRGRLLAPLPALLLLGALGLIGLGTAHALRTPPVAPAALLPAALPQTTTPFVPPPNAETLPTGPAGKAPKQVWQVESGSDFELYSNGLRIELTFAGTHVPRRFRTFERETGTPSEVLTEPVGLLFHTSESDIWPMEESFNENLRESSHNLLRYIGRLHLYNYVIDRFGRVYRIVAEQHKANHAGNSVWANGDQVYLNLNNAFLGVCFETRWEGGQVLPITQAQLNAGRLLTEHLRQRWQITPEMCVTHGLASVNPKKHLIGHHVDWARGFPFEAFGLPDQYRVPAPAVALFGFGYDDDFVKVMGEPWAGVRSAETALAQDAAARNVTLEALRHERQARYDTWNQTQTRDEEQANVAAERSLRKAAPAAKSNKPFSASGG